MSESITKTALYTRLQETIRDVKDFPKEGIIFKDITPILVDAELCQDVIHELADYYREESIDAIAGIESRGFLFGMPLALALDIPFIPIRKSGKLPYETISHEYELEYGFSTIEMHIDAISEGHRVLIHDDLLATGGTAAAAAALIEKLDGEVAGFSFLINLAFLNGSDKLASYTNNIHSLVEY